MKIQLLTLIMFFTFLGNGQNVELLKEINPDGSAMNEDEVSSFATSDDLLFFAAADGVSGNELWVSDGTLEGTVLLKDIREGASSSNPTNFYIWKNELYFVANDGVNGLEVWKSDGTSEGTQMLKNIHPTDSSMGSLTESFAATDEFIFFQAYEPSNGRELWRSDGSTEGTQIVKDLYNGSIGSSPLILGAVDGKVVFQADKNIISSPLFISDGSSSGTMEILDLGEADIIFDQYETIGSNIYALINNENFKGNVLITNGTANGSAIIANNDFDSFFEIGQSNGQFFFGATMGSNEADLWKVNELNSETILVKAFEEFLSDKAPIQMVNYNDALYFYAFDDEGDGLWKSNGTEVGTELIFEFGGYSTNIERRVFSTGDRLLITAEEDSYDGFELFQSYGTLETTELVKDIYEFANDGMPNNYIVFDNNVFFTAQESSDNIELFKMGLTTVVPISAFFSIKKDNDCFGFTNGELKVSVSGGVEPYTFEWNPSNLEGDNPKDLAAGDYSVTITDTDGNTFELNETISQPDEIVLMMEKEDATTGNSDGKAFVTVTGGTAPYNYNWIGQSSTTDTLFNIPSGEYEVSVGDAKVCIKNASVIVDETVFTNEELISQLKIYPTITDDFVYIDKGTLPKISVKIFNQLGILVDQFNSTENISYNVTSFVSGIYFIEIELEDKRLVQQIVVD